MLGTHLDFEVVEVDLVRQEPFVLLFFGGSGEFTPFVRSFSWLFLHQVVVEIVLVVGVGGEGLFVKEVLLDFAEFLGEIAKVVGLEVVGLEIDGFVVAGIWSTGIVESERVKATLNF